MKTSQDQERANKKRQVTKEKEKLHRTMSAQGFQPHQGSGNAWRSYTQLSAPAFYVYGGVSIWVWFTAKILPTQATYLFRVSRYRKRFLNGGDYMVKKGMHTFESLAFHPHLHKGHLNAWKLWIYLLYCCIPFSRKELPNLCIYRKDQKVKNSLITLWIHYGCSSICCYSHYL